MRRAVIAFGMVCLAGLTACESLDKRGYSRQEQGTVGGAVAGGVVGNAATGGSTLGTLGGAAVGGVVGNQAGQNYDERKEREGK